MGAGRVKYLLDSVIVIDHFNGLPQGTAFIADHAAACVLSVITRAEVLTGFNADTERDALELLDAFPALPLTVEIADTAARLRRALRWKLPDAIQAAVAQHHELTLVTRNTRDFQGGREVEVLVPYRL